MQICTGNPGRFVNDSVAGTPTGQSGRIVNAIAAEASPRTLKITDTGELHESAYSSFYLKDALSTLKMLW